MRTKKYGYLLFLMAFSLAFVASVNFGKKPSDLKVVRAYVERLASDEFEGRGTGTPGEAKAAEWLAEEFQKIGLRAAGDSGSYFQRFEAVPKSNPHMMEKDGSATLGTGLVKKLSGRNVIGIIDNGAKHTVIIGAHFDHLGRGDENSLFKGEPAIHYGADDNASGVSAMLLLSSRMKRSKAKKNNYLFIGFSGEEKGLWGSNHFVKNPTIDLSAVSYMLNMDMVGKLDATTRKLALNGTGTSPEWNDVIEAEKGNFELVKSESGVGPSDHTSFYLQNIPVLHFFTGQHEDYHKPSDTAEKLNYEGIVSIADFIERIILAMDAKGKPTFSKTQDQDTSTKAQFKVTLGVVPDYMFEGPGLRLDGVSDGKSAQKAGLAKGDIILMLGDSTINDMKSYVRALGAFQAGDKTTVKALRGSEEQIFPIEFQ
jgi:hypothetical protein